MAPPLCAQEVSEADRDVARGLMLKVGRLAPPVKRPRCEAPKGDDIVVCARNNDQFRAQSSGDEDPTGAGTKDGRLTPPDVSGNGIFKGKPTMTGMCLIPPCAAAAPYMIDLSTIPEAPAGSDADKIAKGEIRAP